ncbi:phosphopentomutase [Anaerobacterium chartisolvens]|uniref:Phosphopentomutase n=1 Tax=Anaerobacterium chartisolvens TaxID=1297424 RepID=A0A369BFC2_9FIRM|nr:phosphopentomutase [Anaerobacterium chartisolvens]RCX19308.1 phosphopentomutase [Anaerobacterium chartisolvens]
MKRAIIIVMDSVGMGELPDAVKYGDQGSNTLGNISRQVGGLRLPNLEKMGLGSIDGIEGFGDYADPLGCYGRMAEMSAGKDTTTGHWEISGIILDRPFPVFPQGFPEELIREFEKAIGTPILGNVVASGTEIIKMLGDRHVSTGYPIVYTSADSVFQIAAHEDVIPREKLYDMCRAARTMLKGQYAVGRVIARPFAGVPGNYARTGGRHDFSLKPSGKTILDYACENGLKVKAVGKIEDIFSKQGITHSVHISDNMDGVDKTLDYMRDMFEGIIFTNLVDFDMLFGHRNDVRGYADALMRFDGRIPQILEGLGDEDILFITADHGCDPTTPSTDHSREYVPLIVYGKKLKRGINLGTRDSFSDIAATVSEYFKINAPLPGKSFYKDVSI